jgi:hypothetical protein
VNPEVQMKDEIRSSDQDAMQEEEEGRRSFGAPGGARQNVRSGTSQGAVARPGGAVQNSGGALERNDEESGHGPGRGAD